MKTNVIMATIAAIFVLSGCATGSVTLTDPLAEHSKVATVQVVGADNTVAIQPEAAKYFEDRLREYLYEADEGRFDSVHSVRRGQSRTKILHRLRRGKGNDDGRGRFPHPERCRSG
jgi:hypothetical protein